MFRRCWGIGGQLTSSCLEIAQRNLMPCKMSYINRYSSFHKKGETEEKRYALKKDKLQLLRLRLKFLKEKSDDSEAVKELVKDITEIERELKIENEKLKG